MKRDSLGAMQEADLRFISNNPSERMSSYCLYDGGVLPKSEEYVVVVSGMVVGLCVIMLVRYCV